MTIRRRNASRVKVIARKVIEPRARKARRPPPPFAFAQLRATTEPPPVVGEVERTPLSEREDSTAAAGFDFAPPFLRVDSD